MFDIGWSELLVIAVVAIVVIGPKDLPRALRTAGQWTGKVRRMARDFQSQFNEAIREAELETVTKEVQSVARMDPLASTKKEMDKIDADVRAGLGPSAVTSTPAAPAPSSAPAVDADLANLKADSSTVEPAPVVAAESKP
jgi:sec-independent protein translocase protein TatB